MLRVELPKTSCCERRSCYRSSLAVGWPSPQRALVARWTGTRSYWFPSGLPQGRLVAIVSSRWGQTPERWEPHLARLREVLADTLEPTDVLLTAQRTTLDGLIRRHCVRQSRPFLSLHLPTARQVSALQLPIDTVRRGDTVRTGDIVGRGDARRRGDAGRRKGPLPCGERDRRGRRAGGPFGAAGGNWSNLFAVPPQVELAGKSDLGGRGSSGCSQYPVATDWPVWVAACPLPENDPQSPLDWDAVQALGAAEPPGAEGLLQPFTGPAGPAASGETWADLPLRDRLLMAAADVLIVVHQRPGGTVERLVAERMAAADFHPGSTVLAGAVAAERGERNRSRRTRQRSATPAPETSQQEDVLPAARALVNASSSAVNEAHHLTATELSLATDEYLLHWTRPCPGPWPDQTMDQFWDELLGGDVAPRTALDVLTRIVRSAKLLATSAAIRGGFSSVSFTALSLAQLLESTVYRTHRRRWDALPYGLGIRRAWLVDQGARPVIYGDSACWQALSAADRPYFQLRATGNLQRSVDWSSEAEWRILGDLSLGSLSSSDAFLFVAEGADAAELRSISPWPVFAVSSAAKSTRRE